MPRGGKREGAGRKAGAATERTREVADRAASEGITPLEYMLTMLRDTNETPANRMWAAEKAAPYLHPKLATIEASVNHTADETIAGLFARVAASGAALVTVPEE